MQRPALPTPPHPKAPGGVTTHDMQELTSPTWNKAKGMLFLVLGLLSVALLVLEHPQPRTLALMAIAIWSLCRFYYFALYVLERYVDPGYRFAGLWRLARYLLERKRPARPSERFGRRAAS